MACIIIDLLRAPIGRARFKPVAEMLRWSRVAEPLACYIAAPWRNGERAMGLPASVRPITLLAKLPGKAVSVLLRRGPIRLLREIYAYLIWRWERS
jgi:hypothetical protein